MSETLWVSLPKQEANALQEVINFVKDKCLGHSTVNQLIARLENGQAGMWIEVLKKYNAIPSIRNLDTVKMLDRVKSIKYKFREYGYKQLENRKFQPNELIGLAILCYSNPTLIGPKLCKALNANNTNDIKKEILENSAYVRLEGRVVPWASNLRLLNYAFYTNDTSVRLPDGIRDRIRQGAEQKGISLNEIDTQIITVRPVNNASDSIHIALQSNDSYADNRLMGESSSAFNATSVNNLNGILMGSLALFHLARNTPVVSAVVRNIAKDIGKASSHIGSFFSKNNTQLSEQINQKTELLSSVTQP